MGTQEKRRRKRGLLCALSPSFPRSLSFDPPLGSETPCVRVNTVVAIRPRTIDGRGMDGRNMGFPGGRAQLRRKRDAFFLSLSMARFRFLLPVVLILVCIFLCAPRLFVIECILALRAIGC